VYFLVALNPLALGGDTESLLDGHVVEELV
jgi:hypothetical protein